MPLIFCPDCGKEVSDSALQCPYCAYPLNRLKVNFSNTLINNNQLKGSYSSKVDLSFLPSGVYTCEFISGNNNIIVKKLIIAK